MHPRLRRIAAGAGAACLTAAFLVVASDTALHAAPLIAVRLRLPLRAPQAALDASATAPSPGPSASPRRRHGPLGDGPIVIKGDGTYQLGVQRQARNGLSTGNDRYSTALSLTAERRTEQTAAVISSAFGYGGGSVSAGSFIFNYRTPRYGLTYGQVTGPSDSQLGIGGFARGVSVSLPSRTGDLSYFASTAQQSDQKTYRIYGARRTWNAFGGFVSTAGYYGASEQGTGRQTILDFGYKRYGAKLSTQTEVALSTTHDVALTPNGTQLATAFHADLQGKSTYTTLGVRYDPRGFQSLTGALESGLTADLAIRRHSDRVGEVDLDLGHSDQRVNGDIIHDNRATLTGGKSWSRISMQYVAGLEGTQAGGSTTLQHTAALTFSEQLKGLALFETIQNSSTSGATGSAQQSQVSVGASRPLLGGSAAYQYARSLSSGAGTALGTSVSQTFSFRRSFGRKLDVQLAQGMQTTTNDGVATRLYQTDLAVVRRLSPVVALQVTGSVARQTGLNGGHSTGFAVSLIGPFGFGQPRDAYGRPNPNLPATIRGIVTFSASSSPFAYNASSLRGYNNVLVILDGKISQRTDSNGEFEFRFVSQGTHTVRIDPATLSPGLISDREYQSVRVLGGQTSSVQFAVGNFAGVSGSVVAPGPGGVKKGLAGVGIAIDGIAAGSTTTDGHYAIGRLNPGAHAVEIIESTLPSTVTFAGGDKKRTVTVTPGSSTKLDFVAIPLGSIAGTVVVPSDGGFGQLIGLRNVYIVAEPGEHAVITDEEGGFILDNLPPGTYTLNVDPDTIPDGLGVLSGPDGPLALSGGANLSGVVFKMGQAAKQVVYTFSDGKKTPIQLQTEPAIVPPGAILRVTARTAAKDVKSMTAESDVFGMFPLRLDAKSGLWTGSVVVPPLAKGDYSLGATMHRKDSTDGSTLVQVDPSVPLLAVRVSPQHPLPGHTLRVTLKSLAPIEEGDTVIFEDGYKIVLPKPSGRVFGFDIRLWQKGLPYSATVVTKRGQNYPISLR